MAVKRRRASHGEDGVAKFTTLMLKDKLKNVLDIGCGEEQTHVNYMNKQGLDAKGVDIAGDPFFKFNYNDYTFDDGTFEGITANHVLEHQLNPNTFLKKIHSELNEEGFLLITVPPLKHQIVGGHVSLWNAGLVIYHLVHAGFDCTSARVLEYGYNISVIVKKKTIQEVIPWTYHTPDILIMREYLPAGLAIKTFPKAITFTGDIKKLSW